MTEIKFAICGIEHSGTTLLSDLCRQVPSCNSGFEVGLLLCTSPREFPSLVPYANNILKGWGVTPADLAAACDTDDFVECYRRLAMHSTVVGEADTFLFDKTPRYLEQLTDAYSRHPMPFLITYKDPRAIVCSDWKRAKSSAVLAGVSFDAWLESYAPPKIAYMQSLYQNTERIRTGALQSTDFHLVRLEDLAMATRATVDAAFAHVGLEFQLPYVLLRNLRYTNTRGGFVSADIVFEYIEVFDGAQQRLIEQTFAGFDAWYYR